MEQEVSVFVAIESTMPHDRAFLPDALFQSAQNGNPGISVNTLSSWHEFQMHHSCCVKKENSHSFLRRARPQSFAWALAAFPCPNGALLFGDWLKHRKPRLICGDDSLQHVLVTPQHGQILTAQPHPEILLFLVEYSGDKLCTDF